MGKVLNSIELQWRLQLLCSNPNNGHSLNFLASLKTRTALKDIHEIDPSLCLKLVAPFGLCHCCFH